MFLSRSLNYEKLRKVKKKKEVNYEKRTEGRKSILKKVRERRWRSSLPTLCWTSPSHCFWRTNEPFSTSKTFPVSGLAIKVKVLRCKSRLMRLQTPNRYDDCNRHRESSCELSKRASSQRWQYVEEKEERNVLLKIVFEIGR